jgi:hypothetical protein
MDQERRRLYAAGGPGLRGIYRALCEYAGDRPYLRGFLLTPDDRPATPVDLASALHLPAKEIAKALRTLSEMQPALVQRVLYEDVEKDLLEARMASQPGETTPTGGESIRDEEVGEHPSDGGSRCSRSICSPEMTDGPRPAGMPSRDDGAPEGRDPPDRSDARGDARPNSNMNVNVELPAGAGKHPPSTSLAGGGQAGKQKQKTQPAIGPSHEGAEGDGHERERDRKPPADADQNGNDPPAHADENGNDPPRARARNPPRHETGPRARDRASSGPTPSGSDGARGARVGPPATEETSKNVHPGQESGRGWRPPGADELPTSIDRLTEAEWIDNTGLGWHDVRYELGKATKFGQLIAWAIGVGVGRAAQDEIQAFAARWDEILAAPIDEGYRIWLAEKLYALAVELNERRMKELRQGRTDPPNYRKIWMAEAKRGLQAAAVAEAKGVDP